MIVRSKYGRMYGLDCTCEASYNVRLLPWLFDLGVVVWEGKKGSVDLP